MSGKKLTDREKEVLQFVIEYRNKNGYSPSMREISAGVFLSQAHSAQVYVERLEDKGYLTYTPRIARSVVPILAYA